MKQKERKAARQEFIGQVAIVVSIAMITDGVLISYITPSDIDNLFWYVVGYVGLAEIFMYGGIITYHLGQKKRSSHATNRKFENNPWVISIKVISGIVGFPSILIAAILISSFYSQSHPALHWYLQLTSWPLIPAMVIVWGKMFSIGKSH